MTTLLVQIAPQRSTQYADLASLLAPLELQISALGSQIKSSQLTTLGGQQYLRCELANELTDAQIDELGTLATGSGIFNFHAQIANIDGPFLQPIETNFHPHFPPDLITARRYKGKTNEMFTHFMCNIARASSSFSQQPWTDLRVFDPLAGGGTTLFVAMALGAEVSGIEQSKKDAQSTATFLKQFLQEKRISHTLNEERLRKQKAFRWLFDFKGKQNRCVLAQGEIVQTKELFSGVKRPHLIVTDLPYGIQHQGQLANLLTQALPIWSSQLLTGGVLVFSWESTRFGRAEMIELVREQTKLTVLDEPPYNQLAHRVDRVIKNRDVLVALVG